MRNKYILLFIGFILALSIIFHGQVGASKLNGVDGGTLYSRKAFSGYFTGNLDYSGNNVLPADSNDGSPDYSWVAIPYSMSKVGDINTTGSLVKFLYDANRSSSAQRITGSAFIVCTMLGHNGGECDTDEGRKIKAADWADLTQRLQDREKKNKIQWKNVYATTVNSFWQGTAAEEFDIWGVYTTLDDVAFFDKPRNDYGINILDDNDNIVYRLLYRCANPVGSGLQAIPVANTWDLSVSSSVTGPDANGNLTWTHTVKNNGPNYSYKNSNDLGTGAGGNNSSNISAGTSISFTSSYSIRSDDAGKNLCRSTKASPKAWDDSGEVESAAACFLVPYNYSLTPSVSIDVPNVIEAGASFNVTPKVNNSGPTKSRETNWELKKTVAGVLEKTYTGLTTFNQGDNSLSIYPEIANDVAAGTKICFELSVQPRSYSDNSWARSSTCLVVGKKPKVQIWGGDLWSDGEVITSTSKKNDKTFGSWIEYGIFAKSAITGAASGSAFAGLGLSNVDSACRYSYLSFANTPKSSSSCSGADKTIGNYSGSSNWWDMADSYSSGDSISGPISLKDKNSGIYTSGDITLNASELSNQSIIIKSTGTVTIADNQTYKEGPYSNISQLPQLIIIANKIIINSGVTRVDAWLISRNVNKTGSIATCDEIGDTLNKCNKQLIVNGPVVTDKLQLLRTFGSGVGNSSGDPAEIFNLRADAYLWSYNRSLINSNLISSVYLTELPVRM
jgi:hypothetical protein